MRIPRFYYPGSLTVSKKIMLTGQAVQHGRQVLRLRAGAAVSLFNGQGGAYVGVIEQLDKKEALIRLDGYEADKKGLTVSIHLQQALLGQDKMDWVLQKAVELGVAVITPIMTKRCKLKLPPERLSRKYQHWQQVIISACEQCGRNVLPTLNPVTPLADCALSAETLVCHPLAERTLHAVERMPRLSVLIGPEGGFDAGELAWLEASDAKMIRLSPNVLRSETAALCAMSILQFYWG